MGTKIDKFQFQLNDFYFKLCKFSPSVISFFANNPFIAKNGDKYIGKVLLTEPATKANIEHCLKNYTTDGMSLIEIFCIAGKDKEAEDYAEIMSSKIKLYDISNSPNPEYDFCKQHVN